VRILKITVGFPTTVIFNGDPAGLETTCGPIRLSPTAVPSGDPVNHHYIGGQALHTSTPIATLSPLYRACIASCPHCGTFSRRRGLLRQARFNARISWPGWSATRLIGPKFVNVDFSATKNFPHPSHFVEVHVSSRAEISILHHSNFWPPPLLCAGIFDRHRGSLPPTDSWTLRHTRDVQVCIESHW